MIAPAPPFAVMPMSQCRSTVAVSVAVVLSVVTACGTPSNVDWPVYQGSDAKTHYTTLAQITPANVSRLEVAWTYDTKDAFEGSEMQSNPVVVDGVLYAMSPKQRAFALDAATGQELWSFDPTGGKFTGPRIRYRGVVVHDGRFYFNYRYRLFSLDAKTGQPIPGWGNDSGWVDLREGLGRPTQGLSVSASTPGRRVQGHADRRHLGAARRCPARPATSAPTT